MQTLVKVEMAGFDGTAHADLHARFERRRILRGVLDAEEARDLRAAERMMLWEQAGCVTLVEYLARHAGLSERVAWERIRVASALGELPAIEDEMEAGRYSYSHVRELVRVVVPATENAWIDHTRGMTVSQVAREISGHKRGDWPDDEKNPDEEWRMLALRVRPSTLARFTAIVKALEDQRGDTFVDEDDKLLAICDAMEADAKTAAEPARVWLTPDLRTFSHGHELTTAEAEVHLCTGTDMGGIHEDGVRVRKAMSDKKKERILARDGHTCAVPGCRAAHYLDVHHIIHVANGGTNDDRNLITLCAGHHRLLHRGLLRIEGHAPAPTITRVTPDEDQPCTRPLRPAWAT